MLAINATGTISGTVAALAHMVPAGRGQVINVVSVDLFPRLVAAAVPALMRDAVRRQQRYQRLVAKGEWPPCCLCP